MWLYMRTSFHQWPAQPNNEYIDPRNMRDYAIQSV